MESAGREVDSESNHDIAALTSFAGRGCSEEKGGRTVMVDMDVGQAPRMVHKISPLQRALR